MSEHRRQFYSFMKGNAMKTRGECRSDAAPLENFTDRIMGYANETFSVLHARFLKKIWGNNRVTNKLHCNQVDSRWEEGRYEVYIPTRDNPEYNLSYYRIAIQVLPEISNETKRVEAIKLQEQKQKPLGNVESELLILIAPKVKRWVPGGVRSFKHQNKPGFFTAIFINKSPEIIWKRILTLILNFLNKRLEGFMESLGFERWLWKWHSRKGHEDALLYIIERFSFTIRQSFFTLQKLYSHLTKKLKMVLVEIGNQNIAKQAVKPLEKLDTARLQRVFQLIREKLKVNLYTNDKGLLFLKSLEVYANG